MSKKPSKGVAFVAILYIIGGVIGVVSFISPITRGKYYQNLSKEEFKEMFKETASRRLSSLGDVDPQTIEYVINTPEFDKMLTINNEINQRGLFKQYMFINGIFGLATLILGIGLLKLKEWGRKGIMIYQIVSIPIIALVSYKIFWDFFDIINEYFPEINVNRGFIPVMLLFQALIGVIVALCIIGFLNHSKVREQFINEEGPDVKGGVL